MSEFDRRDRAVRRALAALAARGAARRRRRRRARRAGPRRAGAAGRDLRRLRRPRRSGRASSRSSKCATRPWSSPSARPASRPAMRGSISRRRTQALLAGRSALGESLVYLADVPLDAKGKAPKLKKQRFLVFADPVPGGRATLQLVDPSRAAARDARDRAARAHGHRRARRARRAARGDRDSRRHVGRRQPRRRIGDAAVPRHRDRRAGLADASIRRPGMEPQLGRVVERDRRPVGAAARAARPSPGTASPASCPRSCRRDAFLQDDRASRAPGRGRLPLHRRAARRLPAHPRLSP